MTEKLERTHETQPSTGWCANCQWTMTVTNHSLNVEVYRGAKAHAREFPGHVASASVTQVHHYVVATRETTSQS